MNTQLLDQDWPALPFIFEQNKAAVVRQPPPSISRPALRYHGGKFRLAEWIIDQFPPHESYVEPFSGGASVLLQKRPSPIEVYNDLDREVVNFFHVLRSRPQDFINAVKLTPFSRVEHKLSHQACEDELESARRFFVRVWQSFGPGTRRGDSGWRYQRNNNRGVSAVVDWDNLDHLWDVVSRLKNVFIECDTALNVIDRFDTPKTLFYCDPPYVFSSRAEAGRGYKHEMTDDQHTDLANRLQTVKGAVIVSGYDTPLYRDLYAGWKMLSRDSRTLIAGKVNKEFLWISPSAELRHLQQKLF